MRVLFFGRLRELAGGERIAPGDIASASGLIAWIAAGDALLRAALTHPSVKIVADNAVIAPGASIAGAREIAFLPPASGG